MDRTTDGNHIVPPKGGSDGEIEMEIRRGVENGSGNETGKGPLKESADGNTRTGTEENVVQQTELYDNLAKKYAGRSGYDRYISEESKARGQRIAYARKKAGMSQAKLAEKIEVNQSTVAVYESGRVDPRCEGLAKIARACGCSADYLVGLVPYPEHVEEKSEPEEEKRAKKIARDFLNLDPLDQDICEALIRSMLETSRTGVEWPGKLCFVREDPKTGEIKMNPVWNYFRTRARSTDDSDGINNDSGVGYENNEESGENK